MITKAILTLLCCAVGAAGAWAQSATSLNGADAAHQRRVQGILHRQVQRQQQANAALHKTTGGQQLQNAVTLSGYNPSTQQYTNIDSLYFTWGGNRQLAQYPNPLDIFIEPEMEFYANAHGPEVLYPPLLMQADSVVHYISRSFPPVNNSAYARYAFTYDATNRPISKYALPTSHQDGLEIIPDVYETYTYNPNGSIASVIKFIDQDTTAAGVSLAQHTSIYTTYNSNGSIQQDSMVYDLSGIKYVTYYYQDAAGNDTGEVVYYIPSGIPILDAEYTYSYDASGRILQCIANGYASNGTLFGTFTDSFAYSGTHAYPALHQSKYWFVNNGLAGLVRRVNTLNATGSLDAQLNLGLDLQTYAWDSLTRSHMFYNTYNNPDSVIKDVYTNNTWRQRTTANLYRYETTSVKDVTAKPVSIGLYPNPAKGLVHLSIPSFKPATRGTANVYDMQGRLVQSCGIVKAEQSIDVSRLPVGMYLVQYSGGDGSMGSVRFVKE